MFAKTRNAITVHFKDTRNDDWLIVGKTHFDKGSFFTSFTHCQLFNSEQQAAN